MRLLLSSPLLSLPLLASAGTNTIRNACSFPIYVTSVSAGDAPPPRAIASNSTYTEQQYYNQTGTAIKITRQQNGIYTNAPVLHFAYTYHAGQDIYYDLSSHNGYDFWGENVVLEGGKDNVQALVWEGRPEPNRVAHYVGDTDLKLTICG